MSNRAAFRPKVIDNNRLLAIVRDVGELDRPDLGGDGSGASANPGNPGEAGPSQPDPLVGDPYDWCVSRFPSNLI